MATNYIEIIRMLVTVVTVAIGWWVVSKQHNKRETRKEIRQFLDKTITLIESLVFEVDSCYSCKNIDEKEKLKQMLMINIMRLERKLLFLNEFIKSTVNATELNELITSSQSFEDINVIKSVVNEELNLLSEKLYGLIDTLEKEYRSTYR